jgi:hypothetical protein
MFLYIVLLLNVLLGLVAKAQTNPPELTILKAGSPVVLDGIPDEPAWQSAEIADRFYQNFPYDTGYALARTEARVTYDDTYLYVSAICYDAPRRPLAYTRKRDFDINTNDCFVLTLDPFKDKTNGFLFAVTPLGVQREGLIWEGGTFGNSPEWDNKWLAKTYQGEDYWSLEIAIPFNTLRFKQNISEWGINFARHNITANERSSWSPVPRMFSVSNIANQGYATFESPLRAKAWRASVMPYAIGGAGRDFENKNKTDFTANAGFDSKVALTSSLNLDLTVNPDFSQVEADQQITNLSRFALAFPELRTFFLENSDLFARVGFSRIRPFFSRNIGLAYNPDTRLYEQVPILGGARVSGKLDKNWRIGLMDVQTAAVENMQLDAQNYFSGAIQRRVFARSNITALFVNRAKTWDYAYNDTAHTRKESEAFNRVGGLEYYFASKTNKITGKVFWLQSFSPENKGDQVANASWISYNGRKLNLYWNHEYVGENFSADVGYVPRKAYWRIEQQGLYYFYPKKSIVVNHGFQLYNDNYYDLSFRPIDRVIQPGYNVNFNNTASINFRFNHVYTYLSSAFDPTNSGGVKLPDSTGYYYNSALVQVQSDWRKPFYYNGSVEYGAYYVGKKTTLNGNLNMRTGSWGVFSAGYTINMIEMPDPYKSITLYLLSLRTSIAFTNEVFFTSFFQYNDQIQNFNVYSRLQWRFRPMSDVFLVYTDNYLMPDFSVRNRTIHLKFVYWLNI